MASGFHSSENIVVGPEILTAPMSRARLADSASLSHPPIHTSFSAAQANSISAGLRPMRAHSSLVIRQASAARAIVLPGIRPSPRRAARLALAGEWPPITLGISPRTGLGKLLRGQK